MYAFSVTYTVHRLGRLVVVTFLFTTFAGLLHTGVIEAS